MPFHTRESLESFGFRSVGRDVKLSTLASIHNPAAIEIGDYTRIDDFCCLSAGTGGISIGRNVHVAAYCSLIGAGRITLMNYANLSSRVAIYSSNDEYSGRTMSNPTVPAAFTGVSSAAVVIGEHVIVGAGTVILPGVTMHRGSGVGALSLVKTDCDELCMYAGAPAKRLGRRLSTMFELQRELETREQRTESSSS